MKNPDIIINNYEKTLPTKSKWESLYRPVFEYMMPGRLPNGDKKQTEIFASLGEQCSDKFVQKLQNILTPVGSDWIELEAGYSLSKTADDLSEINRNLNAVAEICNVYKNVSNFDCACSEFYYDLIAGTACLLISEGTCEKPLRFSVIPINQFSFAEGAFGEINEVYRKITIKKELIPVSWRDSSYTVPSDSADKEVELLEATYFDYEKNIWFYHIINLENKKNIVERSYKTNPFVILRWTKYAGEIYGRGPGMKVINDLKTLNKINEYSLRALAFTIPVFCASQESDYDVDDFVFEPGAINPVPSTLTNNPTITQLGVNQSPDLQAYNIERLEMEIKKNMFDVTIPNDPDRDMTATEISQRANELNDSLNTNFGRLVNEFLYPLTRRIIEILQRFGYLSDNIDIAQFNGFGYKIKINTDLGNQAKEKQVQRILNAVQTLLSLDSTQTLAPKVINFTALAPYMMQQMGVPENFINSEEEIQQLQMNEALAGAILQQQKQTAEVKNA